jgi:segregation and condensation protein A
MAMKQEELFDVLFNKDDITWQTMIYELVRKEQMNPWDIDIALLSQRFLETLQKLKEMDFRISGKIILAAAILLRLKSYKLVTEDLSELDRLISMSEQTEQEFYDELEQNINENNIKIKIEGNDFTLTPRTPQPRKRKVSVYDLVEALQKALEVKKRRMARIRGEDIQMDIPKKVVDMNLLIQQTYNQIAAHFLHKKDVKKMTFTELVNNSNDKNERIYAFVPLLHLTTHRKIDIDQEGHLTEITITLSDVHAKLAKQREVEEESEKKSKEKAGKENNEKKEDKDIQPMSRITN